MFTTVPLLLFSIVWREPKSPLKRRGKEELCYTQKQKGPELPRRQERRMLKGRKGPLSCAPPLPSQKALTCEGHGTDDGRGRKAG